MRNTARPRNTTDKSISMAELLCLGLESTKGAVWREDTNTCSTLTRWWELQWTIPNEILIAQCDGFRKMTPSAYRSVPYKPHCAIQTTIGLDFLNNGTKIHFCKCANATGNRHWRASKHWNKHNNLNKITFKRGRVIETEEKAYIYI